MVLALDLESQVHLHSGEYEKAIASTKLGLSLAQSMDYKPLIWRLLARRIRAFQGLGQNDQAQLEREEAAEVIREMAACISDEGLRTKFLSSSAIASIAVSEGERG